MNKVSSQAMKELLESNDDPVLSIYMPTHRISTPSGLKEDETRYKNILKKVAEDWREYAGEEVPAKVWQQLEDKAQDDDFWQSLTEGLAIFANKESVYVYHLPFECEERVSVGSTYDLSFVAAVSEMNQPYYVLALAMHNSKLYAGDLYGLNLVDVDFPKSMEDALNIDEMFINSQTLKSHSGPGASNPHGEGDSSEAGREERLKYFRIIEQMIVDYEGYDASCPVLLAATDSEAGDFRAHSKSLDIVKDRHLAGNHTETPLAELHDLATKEMYEAFIRPQWKGLIDEFNQRVGVGKASDELDEVIEATKVGRVDVLLLPLLEASGDTIRDSAKGKVPLLRYPDNNQEFRDTIQALVSDVIKQGGRIVGIGHRFAQAESMLFGALMRY